MAEGRPGLDQEHVDFESGARGESLPLLTSGAPPRGRCRLRDVPRVCVAVWRSHKQMDERALDREQLLVCVKHGKELCGGELPAAVCACVREPRLSGVCLARAQYSEGTGGGAINANQGQIRPNQRQITSNHDQIKPIWVSNKSLKNPIGTDSSL